MDSRFNPELYGEYAAFLSQLGEDNSRQYHTLRARLGRAISEELTERQMLMVTLYYIEGFTMPQIAERLGINKSTVCRTLKRGRDRLGRCLKYGAGELLE